MTKNIVYQASIQSDKNVKFYFAFTETFWKICFNKHKLTLNNEKYKTNTALSKYYQQLKDGGNTPIIMRDIIARNKSYSGKGK